MVEVSQAERIAALEVQMSSLQSLLSTHITDSRSRHDKMTLQLEELLGLRNKGIGAFWLMSALAGTGIIGVALSLLDWFKGLLHG